MMKQSIVEKMIVLRSEGHSCAWIGELLGVSRQRVWTITSNHKPANVIDRPVWHPVQLPASLFHPVETRLQYAGNIIIPAAYRNQLHLKKGDVIELNFAGDHIEMFHRPDGVPPSKVVPWMVPLPKFHGKV
jgi:hypothetical protein